jgi:rubrerythrin
MHLKEKKFLYLNEEHVFNFVEELQNGIKIKMFIGFQTDKFLDFQKDLIQDFVAELKDKINNEHYDIDDMKDYFETSLQNLNVKFKAFADKVRDVDYFAIK